MKEIVSGRNPRPVGAVDPEPSAPLLMDGAEVGILGPSPLVGVAFFLVWVTVGLVTALALSRRGHDLRSTGTLGFVFGPLFIPLAVHLRRRQAAVEPVLVAPGRTAGGPVDVLVGLECRPEGAASVLPVLELLKGRLGRVTLARVLDFESMQDEKERERAEVELSCASLFLGDYEPSLVLLAGRPCQALRDHAAAAGFDAVVIAGGSRGARLGRLPAPSDGPRPQPPVLVVPDVQRRERRA